MKNKYLKSSVLAAMFLALGIVLPFLTGQIPQIGKMLLPMHIPAILCGLICGPVYGCAVGIIMPLLRSVIFSAPPIYPMAVAMAFELGTYGLVSGLLYKKTAKTNALSVYPALIGAMLAGRAVWGIVMCVLLGIGKSGFTFKMFFASAFVTALPGIVLQLLVIPFIIFIINKSNLMPFGTGEQKNENKP